MNEVLNVIKNKATPVDALEDVVEPLAGQAEISDIGEWQRLSHEEEELIGKVEDHRCRRRRRRHHVRERGRARWMGCIDGVVVKVRLFVPDS